MKRETYRHPKTYDLANRLGIDRPAALGRLELLWDYTGEVAPQGDIGKWPNAAIAAACDWTGDPDEFVNALVASKWLDAHEDYRLVVHDWPDHCQDWVKKKLKRMRSDFLPCYQEGKAAAGEPTDGQSTAAGETPDRQRPDSVATPSGQCCDVFPPIQTEPNGTEPNPSLGFGSVPSGRSETSSETAPPASGEASIDWDAVCRLANAACLELGKLPDCQREARPGQTPRLRADTPQDRGLILRVCARTHQGVLPANWLPDAIQATIRASPREPWAYLQRCLANMAGKAKPQKLDLTAMLDGLDIPERLLKPKHVVR